MSKLSDRYLKNRPANACLTCHGCKFVATDEDQSPWWVWEDLEPPANMAVVMGLVQKVTCPTCNGSGEKP